jgi:hypothetical protein
MSTRSQSPLDNTMAPALDVTSPSFMNNACNIWLCPSEARTIRELRAMPATERERVWADLSGGAIDNSRCGKLDPSERDQEQLLLQLEKELVQVEGELPPCQAVKKYIGQRSFLLMFLLSASGDPAVAAKKIVKNLQVKKALFGSDYLARDITLADLTEGDMAVLHSGCMQLLPQRDRNERRILLCRSKNLDLLDPYTPDQVLRASFYAIMATLQEDERTRKHGVVVISYLIDHQFQPRFNYELHRRGYQFEQAMPFRVVAHYILFQNSIWQPVIDVLCHMSTPALRMRTRSIFGEFVCFVLLSLSLWIDGCSFL